MSATTTLEPQRAQIPLYCQSLDREALLREYAPAPEYFRTFWKMSRDEVNHQQWQRLQKALRRAWEVPFYRRLWATVGATPADIKTWDDFARLPAFDINEFRQSIDRHPPFGDFQGVVSGEEAICIVTSGGTTGFPRPMFYTPIDREVQAITVGRALYLHGVRPGDIVQLVYPQGSGNAGSSMREGCWWYSGAACLSTGGGNETPTEKQVEMASRWGVTVIAGIGHYLRHFGMVARKNNVHFPQLRILHTHLGITERREHFHELFGEHVEVFDSYGSHEAYMTSTECPAHDGLHIWEDSRLVEFLNPQTLQPVPDGERGVLVLTAFYKHAAPIIRFNTNDISRMLPGTCACGSTSGRMDQFLGRADQMVKIRGMNVFPMAVGEIVTRDPRVTSQYICIVDRAPDLDAPEELTVKVEARSAAVDRAALARELAEVLRNKIGVRMTVEVAGAGDLTDITEASKGSGKARVLLDRRYTSE